MYSKRVQSILKKKNIKPGCMVEVRTDQETIRGVLMPRPMFGDSSILIIKIENGYNIGVKSFKSIKRLSCKSRRKSMSVKQKLKSPKITIISTGGTVLSRVDYTTGGVVPITKPEELLAEVPELVDIASIRIVNLLSKFSENITPKDWQLIAKEIYKQIPKSDGIVVLHGTDTLSYTSAALSFMLQDLPVPVILTGAQRSSDRPSTDAVMNIICSVKAATLDISGVYVCMHATMSDDYCYLHNAARVRKCHTSRRDAFKSDRPLAKISLNSVEFLETLPKRKSVKPKLCSDLDTKIQVVYVHPGAELKIDKDSHALVLIGTGLGHVPESWIQKLKRYKKPIVITSQCVHGRINLNVYSTGRLLQSIGVHGHLIDALPETMIVKTMWALGQGDINLIYKNIAGEIA
ncbi:Glu-tRNA(Gln) amidotransferase GatDE subunit D [Nanoarchaeota archaeon]|nr:MAG: Glu-tRNA(Gln) amidotransferase GatDE subunit D [Nanoarchaeota archaeon]